MHSKQEIARAARHWSRKRVSWRRACSGGRQSGGSASVGGLFFAVSWNSKIARSSRVGRTTMATLRLVPAGSTLRPGRSVQRKNGARTLAARVLIERFHLNDRGAVVTSRPESDGRGRIVHEHAAHVSVFRH